MNRRALLVTLVLLAVGVALDVATGSKNLPGYSASIGLLGGVAIVLGAKMAGRVLSHSEDLYPDDTPGTASGAVHDD